MIPLTHQNFIERIKQTLIKDARITGLLVGGSYLTNNMDEYSDIDFIIVINNEDYEEVFKDRLVMIKDYGILLAAFTGEHVGEPRLVISLYDEPLLHVDFKFVKLDDVEARVEEPAILWERDFAISKRLKLSEAVFPIPSLQWLEDCFWIWVHYATVKIGRGELFEAIEFISFLRQTVVGPLILLKHQKLPRGVRKIEVDAKEELQTLIDTVAIHNVQSCLKSLNAMILLYVDLRVQLASPDLQRNDQAKARVLEYLDQITVKMIN